MHPHLNTGVEKRFIISLCLTLIILVAEVAGGLWTGSLALLSDAAHVFMDVFALGLSFLALRLSAMPPDNRHSYGFHRLEVLAALANGATLAIIAVGIFYESYQRWFAPTVVRSLEMLIIAAIGLVVNLIVAYVLGGHTQTGEHAHHQEDINLHSAFLHVVGDAVSSVGVILAAIIIFFTGYEWVDPLVSVLIGLLILFSGYRILRGSLHILVEGVPEGLSLQKVAEEIVQVPGVIAVHDLHIWSICSGHVALSAHLLLDETGKLSSRSVMEQLKENMSRDYGINHTTIQFDEEECAQDGGNCGGVPTTLSPHSPVL
jgi:cobalt-zinc-cadmium efflux system protein